ncbi:MAG TPA: hypothetical protein VF474_02065 [Phenylobacterium sp.]
MIRHVSIPARDPRHVAAVLAEVMQGHVYPFPGPVPGAFMAAAGDAHGTQIEVYPEQAAAAPGEGDAPGTFEANPAPPRYWPFHVLLSVQQDEAAIQAIGDREGWRTRRFHRGPPGRPLFDVIEFWVENRFLIEISTPDMDPAYLRTCEGLEAMMARA